MARARGAVVTTAMALQVNGAVLSWAGTMQANNFLNLQPQTRPWTWDIGRWVWAPAGK
jgi:hypothetical protein